MNEQSQLIEISGLWTHQSKNGSLYMAGYMGNASILIFKNKFKSLDKHPDYVLYIREGKAAQDARERQALADDSFTDDNELTEDVVI